MSLDDDGKPCLGRDISQAEVCGAICVGGRISKCVTGKVLQVLQGKYQSDPFEYGSVRVSGTDGGC